jgi:hypothetical protein
MNWKPQRAPSKDSFREMSGEYPAVQCRLERDWTPTDRLTIAQQTLDQAGNRPKLQQNNSLVAAHSSTHFIRAIFIPRSPELLSVR